ncbi:MAG: hypothetical protein V3W31_07590 [Thermodesulfobacteriota bacterium]
MNNLKETPNTVTAAPVPLGNEKGQTLIEYALLIVVVVIAIVGVYAASSPEIVSGVTNALSGVGSWLGYRAE